MLSRCLPWLALITLGAVGCQQRDFPNYPRIIVSMPTSAMGAATQ